MAVSKVYLLNQRTPVIIPGGLVPKGAYDNATNYAVGDQVDYNGSSYIMYVDAVAGTLPTDDTKWGIIAEKGDTGATGAAGSDGVDGVGVPVGGTTGQVLAKVDNDDYDTEWVDQTGGGGAVDSVNGQTGVVVVDADDIDDTSTTNKFTTASDISKLAGIEASADVTDSTNVNAAGATMNSDTSLVGNGYFLDEDNMASNDATKVPSQQSVKAYVDANGSTIVEDTLVAKGDLLTFNGTNIVKVGAGADGRFLKANASETAGLQWSEVTQDPVFDSTVDAAGNGDYTSLGAAIAGGATSIFIKNGTYAESAVDVTTANVQITGESKSKVLLNFNANNFTLTGDGIQVQNVQITTTTGQFLVVGDSCTIFNNIINVGPTTQQFGMILGASDGGEKTRFSFNTVNDTTTNTSYARVSIAGNFSQIAFNYFDMNGVYVSSTVGQIAMSASNAIFSNNYVNCKGTGGQIMMSMTGGINQIVANYFHGQKTAGTNAFYCDGPHTNFSGNNLMDNFGWGVYVDSADSIFHTNNIDYSSPAFKVAGSGNVFNGNFNSTSFVGATSPEYCFHIVSGTRNSITNNLFRDADDFVFRIDSGSNNNYITNNQLTSGSHAALKDDNGTGNVFIGNMLSADTPDSTGATAQEKDVKVMYNDTGGSITAGQIVILKDTAQGSYVTTTTTAGNSKVFGVVESASISNGYGGQIQTYGKTTTLKVNGTDDIAIGDYISTSTVAGVGKKCDVNETAIAIALEAYTANDSSGVIDALIIAPRIPTINTGDGTGPKVVSILLNDATAMGSGDGKAYFRVPDTLAGMNLIEVAASRASGTGTPTIQIYNVTQAADMLTTRITIDSGETDSSTAATAAVIDGANDDVTEGDRLRIDVDDGGTDTLWLEVQMKFELP